jgi:hypothetical protein
LGLGKGLRGAALSFNFYENKILHNISSFSGTVIGMRIPVSDGTD